MFDVPSYPILRKQVGDRLRDQDRDRDRDRDCAAPQDTLGSPIFGPFPRLRRWGWAVQAN